MWLLKSVDGGVTHRLLTDKEYIVGRKDCDIVIEGDKSISRKHAVLTVTFSESQVLNYKRIPILRVQDYSKFGTTVNREKVTEIKTVNDSDIIKFGGIFSKWNVKFEPFVVTTSSLSYSARKLVQSALHQLGGHLTSEWQEENNFLVMSNLVLTIKAVCALISGKEIITPEYLEAAINSIRNKTDYPLPENFCPVLREPMLSGLVVDFSPTGKRKSLFKNKRFLFSSEKQLKKLEIPIQLAGGIATHYSSVPSTELLLAKGVCLVSLQDEELNQSWIPSAMEHLKKRSKRVIRECEIGMAVVLCSTDKYCNPDFDLVSTLFGELQSSTQTQSSTQSSAEIYAVESQKSSNHSSAVPSRKLVPNSTTESFKQSKITETLLSKSSSNNQNEPKPKKHRLDDDSNYASGSRPPKIPKTETLDDDEIFSLKDIVQRPSCPDVVCKQEVTAMDTDTNSRTTASQETLRFEDDIVSDLPPKSQNAIIHNGSSNTEITDHVLANGGQFSETRKFIVIEEQNLIKRTAAIRLAVSRSIKNFKKFRKVHNVRTSVLPQIIGGSDLQEYAEDDNDGVTGWTQEMNFLTTDHGTQEEDLFDWAPKRGGRGLRGR